MCSWYFLSLNSSIWGLGGPKSISSSIIGSFTSFVGELPSSPLPASASSQN